MSSGCHSVAIVLCLLGGLILLGGCSKERTGVVEPSKDQPKLLASEEAIAPDAKAGVREMLKTHARKREVMVGGCRNQCEDYKQTFQNYIQSLRGAPDGGKSISFLESSEMVFNGERLGDTWVALWKDGRIEERRTAIAEFADTVSEWARKVEDTAIEEALATGVRYGEDDDPGFVVYFERPDIEGGSSSSHVWRYRIQERGWEWLISAIDTQGF